LYRAPAGSWQRLLLFFGRDVPRLYCEAGRFVLASFLMFALPALAAYLVALGNPSAVEEILPARMTSLVREGRLWVDIEAERRSLFASVIMTNNLQVSILAFAGGILLGTLTTYVLIQNGLMLGAVFGYTQVYGLAGDLAGFVSPHGYLELSVIFIAGGAGLQLAWAVISPGLLRRRDALTRAAQRAVLLLVGSAPWMVIAGLIEGFISPSGLPREAKLLFGALTGLALYLFLLWPWIRKALQRQAAARRPH
jgi:uncharacterized membrane protein SpoIIM required for sporulation